MIDRIVREHQTIPPQPGRLHNGTAELLGLYHRIGAATLFDGAWRLLPNAEHGHVSRGYPNPYLATIMKIPDDRVLAAAVDLTGETMHWVTCRVEDLGVGPNGSAGRRQRLLDDPHHVPVYGTSLALILRTILDEGDLAGLETGWLADLDDAVRAREPVDAHAPATMPDDPASEPGPDAGLDEVRAAKESAIDQQHFERAARLRDREKALLREEANRRGTGQSEA